LDGQGQAIVIDIRPVLLVVGVLLATLGCAMMLPALYDLALLDADWQTFAVSAAFTLFVGIGLAFANSGHGANLTIRQGFLLVAAAWVLLTAFGALPLAWSQLDLSFTDAYFEAMSAITTTGSTVITGLDEAPAGILLWRALLQWAGGLGIIFMAVAILPMLQVGGMQLFRIEAFEIEDKVLPRATEIARWLLFIYLGLTALCALAYYAAGMSLFDAVTHSMTTLATGGFSTHDASIAYFSNNWIEFAAIVFMCLASLPFVLYVRALKGDFRVLVASSQVRGFFVVIAVFVALAWIAYRTTPPEPAPERLLTIAFNVVSIITTTGYATTAYDNWSSMAVSLFFVLTFIGGCQCSTSGGIKIFRLQVIYKAVRMRVKTMIWPSGVFTESYNGKPLAGGVARAVMGFFFLYLLSFLVIAALLNALGLDPLTAMSATVTAMSNVGPGLGPIVGPVGSFAPLPDAAKWILSFAMLLGRLELFTVLVLLTPVFWRV